MNPGSIRPSRIGPSSAFLRRAAEAMDDHVSEPPSPSATEPDPDWHPSMTESPVTSDGHVSDAADYSSDDDADDDV